MSCEDFDRALFNVVSASDYCDKVADGTHDSPKEVPDGRPLVTSKHLKNGKILVENAYHISQNDFDAVNKRSKVDPFDIIFSMIGTIGEIAQVKPEYPEFAIKNVGLFKLSDKSKSDWLKYFLQSPQGKNEVELRKKGSTQQYVSLTDLRALPIPVPKNSDFRDRVLGVLQPIDDLIDSLQAQNTVLELIAQTLFKSWFVNFDPVYAKAAGRESEGLSAEIAALFPSELEESGLGLIPKGWKFSSIYEIADIQYGAPFKSKEFNTLGNGRPLVRIRDLKTEEPGVFTPERNPRGYLLQGGDIVVGMDGEFQSYIWGNDEAWMNQRVCVFHPKSVSSPFLRNTITPQLLAAEKDAVATTVIHIGKKDLDTFTAIRPSEQIQRTFDFIAQPLYDLIVANKLATKRLAKIRDELLPRLISGKIRIEEAEEALADVIPSTEKQVA
ncbi:hypothetical protein BSZ31_00215 [Limnobacter sp. SAORIC-690]|uniref:restriction endonuclease subunit S n=1 Tax=Limnobacter sp. SAORIC-690 TaxID=1923970 RepID=UPI000CF552F6|nr:restriction endonuclease subunit S [Limnobacter sp. SAORIC-690]PQJ23634.1 hypothetical protein BSZ31_00215 [Limnobacter sp. SAORIC-690]